MHMALSMYTCSCMPTTSSPSPGLPPPPPPPPPPSAYSIRMPQRMYASVPRCMPIVRLGLIHNTMPPISPKGLTMCGCVCVCVHVHVSACVCMYVRITKGGFESLRLSICICLCKSICVSHARTYNNGGLQVE